MGVTGSNSANFRNICPATSIPANLTIRRRILNHAEKTEAAAVANQVVKELAERWDKTENKSSVVLLGGGAVELLWLSSTIVGAVNNIPLLPKLMELIGLLYTAWFVYRYLLFKSSRQVFMQDFQELRKKMVSGDQ